MGLIQEENIFDFDQLLQPIITTDKIIEDHKKDSENAMFFKNISPTLIPSLRNKYVSLLCKICDITNV